MAGAVVHEKFFRDSLDNSKCYNRSGNNLNIYAQGHDLLLYIETWNFIRNRQLSLLLSNYKFQEFVFYYLKSAISNESIYECDDVKLFLYGYISHHMLDSYFHPFVMQYSEDYLPVVGKRWVHGVIETLYDSSFIDKYYGEEPLDFKLYENLKYDEVFNNKFIKNIDDAGRFTYNVNSLGEKMNRSFNSVSRYMKLYRYDPSNSKKSLGELVDLFISMGCRDFFYSNDLSEFELYKNSEHKEWINYFTKDSDKKVTSDLGLDDLYVKAMEDTSNIINCLESIIYSERVSFRDISDIVPNVSAITGLECGKELKFIKKKKGIRYE